MFSILGNECQIKSCFRGFFFIIAPFGWVQAEESLSNRGRNSDGDGVRDFSSERIQFHGFTMLNDGAEDEKSRNPQV